MNKYRSLKLKLLIICLLSSYKLFAHVENFVLSSGRDHDLIDGYKDDLEHISEVSEDLGLTFHKEHYVTFVPSAELSALVSNGRYPLPFWLDGYNIWSSYQKRSGVLEFVTGGPGINRSFYQDTTSVIDQRMVIMHVMGHNDFANNSIYNEIEDPMSLSAGIALKMSELNKTNDSEKGLEYLQYLQSLPFLQNITTGRAQKLEDFTPTRQTDTSLLSPYLNVLPKKHPDRREKYKNTYNVFPALAALVSESAEEWKSYLFKNFQRLNGSIPHKIHTKIINEGWATFCEELILRHSKWKDDIGDFIKLGHMMWAVSGNKSLSNPYYLGREGWVNLYENFVKENTNDGSDDLSLKELDRKFIKEVAHPIINSNTSHAFIRKSLDSAWVNKNKYFLYRNATSREIDEFCRGKDRSCWPQENEKAVIVTSRESKRIINFIARTQADFQLKIPQIELVDMNDKKQGIILLNHVISRPSHSKVGDLENIVIPLHLSDATKTLYVIAKLMKAPISLTTVHYYMPLVKENLQQSKINGSNPIKVLQFLRDRYKGDDLYQTIPIRIDVTPRGDVEVSITEELKNQDNYEEEILKIKRAITHSLKQYLADLELSAKKTRHKNVAINSFHRLAKQILEKFINRQRNTSITTDEAMSKVDSFDAGITTGEAVLKFYELLDKRFANKLKKAVKGKTNVSSNSNGMSLRVLPEIPTFSNNTTLRKLLISLSTPSAVDYPDLPPVTGFAGMDDDADIGISNQYLVGEIIKIKSNGSSQNNLGQADNDTELDEEELEQGKDGEGLLGEGNNKQQASDIQIDLEELGKALGYYIELPNQKITKHGKNKDKEMSKRVIAKKPIGKINWTQTAVQGVPYAFAENYVRTGEFFNPDETIIDVVTRGLKYIRPKDYVRVVNLPEKTPNSKAVVVIAMDFSGSMAGEPQKMARQFAFNLKAILKANYDEVAFRYIIFDNNAEECDEDAIFGTNPKFLNGGTNNVVGHTKALEVISEYNSNEWNKYFLSIGDAGSSDGAETVKIMKKILDQSQHISYLLTLDPKYGGIGSQDFIDRVKSFTEIEKWASFAQMHSAHQSEVFRALTELYGNKRKK